MKKSDVITLVNAGVLSATQHELAGDGYKVFKFKSQLRKAFLALQEAESDLVKECGIEDPMAFDARMLELRQLEKRSDEEKKEFESMNEKLKNLIAQKKELYDEDVTFDVKIPLTYEEWVVLQNENRAVEIGNKKFDVFSGDVEELLFGLLWKAPEEE